MHVYSLQLARIHKRGPVAFSQQRLRCMGWTGVAAASLTVTHACTHVIALTSYNHIRVSHTHTVLPHHSVHAELTGGAGSVLHLTAR